MIGAASIAIAKGCVILREVEKIVLTGIIENEIALHEMESIQRTIVVKQNAVVTFYAQRAAKREEGGQERLEIAIICS